MKNFTSVETLLQDYNIRDQLERKMKTENIENLKKALNVMKTIMEIKCLPSRASVSCFVLEQHSSTDLAQNSNLINKS